MFELHARCTVLRWVVVLLALGCGAPAPLRTPPAPEAEPELHHGALVDYVPAAGLRWLIAGSPRALARAPALSELRQRWLDATRVDDELVAFAVEDLALARVVESFALRRLENVATAFEGAALSGLPPELRAPLPLALYLLGPLDPERVAATEELGGARALLAHVSALAVTLEPEGRELALQLALVGSWQGAADAERLLAAWLAFAASPLGRRLGLDTPLGPPDAAGSESLLRLRTRLEGKVFALGLERSLTGDVGELLGATPRPSPPQNAPRW